MKVQNIVKSEFFKKKKLKSPVVPFETEQAVLHWLLFCFIQPSHYVLVTF